MLSRRQAARSAQGRDEPVLSRPPGPSLLGRGEAGAIPASGHGQEAGARREIVLVTGISGSGKSVALHALEDAGFFCIDNSRPSCCTTLLPRDRGERRIASRSMCAGRLAAAPAAELAQLKGVASRQSTSST